MDNTHVTLDIDDIRRAGSVAKALAAWCEESDDTSCGVVGSGWSKNHDAGDFSRRAFEEGALHYLDTDDGRLRSTLPADDVDDDDELPDDVCRDIGGCLYRIGDWSDESVVRLECPDIDDAMQYPDIAAEMAREVISSHSPESNCDEWRKLIEQIQSAAQEFDGIDAGKLWREIQGDSQ